MPGFEKAVNVVRDRWGVAHIYAESQHDLFFAQGFVVAQDRLFQMELWKRSGQGRLAEILGPAALPRDVNARRLRYRGDMEAEYKSYGSDTKEILQAFTDGINAFIAERAEAGWPWSAHRIPHGGIQTGELEARGLLESHGGILHDRQRLPRTAARSTRRDHRSRQRRASFLISTL